MAATPAGVDVRVARRAGFRVGGFGVPPVPSDPSSRPIAEVAATVAEQAERVGQRALRSQVSGWSRAERRLVALQVHFACTHDEFPVWGSGPALVALLHEPVGFTPADLRWALALLDETEHPDGPAFHLPARIAAELPDAAIQEFEPVFQAVAAAARSTLTTQRERHQVAQLYGAVLDRLGDRLPDYLLHDGDDIGPAVRAALGDSLGASGLRALLLHAFSLTKPVPTRGWLRTAESRLIAAPTGPSVVSAILEMFARLDDHPHEDTDTLARGLVWLLAFDTREPATELLARVAVAAGSTSRRASGQPFAPRTAAAAVEALAGRPGDAPPRALARLVPAVTNKVLRARAQTALDRASAARGWAPGEAAELAVDDHELDEAGVRSFPGPGGLVLEVAIDGDKPRLQVMRHGKPLKHVPSGVDVAEPRALVKLLGQTLGRERARIEGLFAEGREWSWERWHARYLSHPVTGSISRRLIWETSDDGVDWTAGLPAELPVRARVRLWHPLGAEPGDVAAWRDRVTEGGLRQPVKQAFREIYPLTPAEAATRVYSNRFAGHILRYRQAAALMRTRGWQGSYLGFFDGGYDGEATREFGGWRASFYYELADQEEDDFAASFCATDQVRFARQAGGEWVTAPLAEVPPLVFSEAMRDVDLFVGVTSIAADEAWADRGEHRFHDYWARASFGELGGSATVRRDVLGRLLPRLTIGPQCELTGRFLRVRGTRASYLIHLGSGNILIEPNDRYLCIVPDRGAAARQPAAALPFEDDRMLSLILSKAIMLAADDRISDRTILQQLPR